MKNCILFKKEILTLLRIFFILLFPFAISAQTTIYKETVGSCSGTVHASSYGGWVATDAANVAAIGSVNITNGIIPSNYTGASGGTPIQIAANSSFRISGINTSGYGNIKLSFGIHKSNKNHSGSDLQIQVSADGVTFTNLTMELLPTNNGSGNAWFYRTGGTSVTGYIPQTNNLTIRFTTTSASPYDFDDIELKADIALPLHLLGFHAQRTNNNNTQISWTTEDEVNVDHFEIQRSEDANSFKTIQTLTARNNSTLEKYVVSDILPIKMKAYYRLYCVDKDGKSSYSTIAVVNSGTSESFSISVNSITKELIIDHNSAGSGVYHYSIVNMNGQVMQDGQITLNSRFNKISFKDGITKGIYVVHVISENNSRQIKTSIL